MVSWTKLPKLRVPTKSVLFHSKLISSSRDSSAGSTAGRMPSAEICTRKQRHFSKTSLMRSSRSNSRLRSPLKTLILLVALWALLKRSEISSLTSLYNSNLSMICTLWSTLTSHTLWRKTRLTASHLCKNNGRNLLSTRNRSVTICWVKMLTSRWT